MKRKFFFLIAALALLGNGCKKENQENIPGVVVDVYIYSSSPAFASLNAVGGWTYVSGGVRGILVYRRGTDEFMAYERNCTYQSTNTCATVSVDASGVIAKDTCCNSQFAMYDGTVMQGPANLPLRTYRTSFDGNLLHIFN
jgi:nitrite reductase/ring-hydroxylating ferredoxin subunit